MFVVEMQVHIQTIGILVAEKTELQSNLSQNQRSTEQIMGTLDKSQLNVTE